MGKTVKIKLFLKTIVITLMFAGNLAAQDPQFSQFYAAPLYLNPAFTGTCHQHRLTANYRRQWPNLPSKFITTAFSYEYFHKKWNSGFGALLMADQAGGVKLGTYSGNFMYSYMVRLNQDWVARAGLNFGITSRSLDNSKLLFGDQLILGGKYTPPTKDEQSSKSYTVNYFDVGSGIFVYSKKYWLGFAAGHLNEPNQSLTEKKSSLPMKFALHGGVRLPLYNGPIKRAKIAAVAPSFLYKRQGPFDQLDLGIHFYYEPMMLGFWYRGIPVQKQVDRYINQDALVFLFGFKYEDFAVGYSYDLSISKMGPTTGGAHEFSLTYEIFSKVSSKKKKPRRKDMFMPCPTFMK